jgi:hypothetical protein
MSKEKTKNETVNNVNPFIGTWENEHGRFVFTKTTVVAYALPAYTNSLTNETLWYSGTYNYDENNVYITTNYRVPEMLPISDIYPQPLVYQYSFDDDKLIWATIIAFTKIPDR